MDLENKPNMKGTRIGGGYMVVGYGSGGCSGGGIWIRIGGGIWIPIQGGGTRTGGEYVMEVDSD